MKKNPPYYHYLPDYTSFRDMMRGTIEQYADKPFLTYRVKPTDKESVTVTFRVFCDDARAFGTEAILRGFSGKRVALIGKLSYERHVAFLGLSAAGVVTVPLDPDWAGEDLTATIAKAGCVAIFAEEKIFGKLDTLPDIPTENRISIDGKSEFSYAAFLAEGKKKIAEGERCFDERPEDPDALAEIVFTSGTTGKGKGVMLSEKAIVTDVSGAFSVLKLSKRTMEVLPPHHSYGSTIGFLSEFANGANMYISSGIRYVQRELEDFKPTSLILVPLYLETFQRKILAAAEKSGKDKALFRLVKFSNALRKIGIDLRRPLFAKRVLGAFGGELRAIVSGGAPISQELMDFFDGFGIRIMNGFGITECGPLVAANRDTFSVRGSVGVPILQNEVKIDEPNEAGEGEILVRGANVMMGYFDDPEATAEAIDKDGFFHTGDLGRLDQDVLFITGRKKNLIILSNGKNLYPEEVETVLSAIPGTLEVIVYEGQSKRGAEHNAVVAEIYPDKDYLERHEITDADAYFGEKITAYNRTAISYKKIDIVRVRTEEFPKNTLQKILRFKLDRTID